jgi:hypothetical protein
MRQHHRTMFHPIRRHHHLQLLFLNRNNLQANYHNKFQLQIMQWCRHPHQQMIIAWTETMGHMQLLNAKTNTFNAPMESPLNKNAQDHWSFPRRPIIVAIISLHVKGILILKNLASI